MMFQTEQLITFISIILALVGSFFILRLDWKKYGLLYLLSGAVGIILCYIFINFRFYSFPYRPFSAFFNMPVFTVLTVFPFYVLLAVRYSPREWGWKIPFYWALVHLGVFVETWAQYFTGLIRYDFQWDLWDSYTWWWIYLLVFEWIGGLIIPDHLRNPLRYEWFRYGRSFWFVLHFILIVTIFLGGFYLGRIMP